MNLWNKTFKPMLLDEIDKPFNSTDYIYEMKYDGIRCLMYVSKNNFKLISRNNLDMTYLFPELKSICSFINNNIIFDGEIVSLDKGKPNFSKLQSRNRLKNNDKIKRMSESNPVIFVCFDILYKDKDLTNLTLMERKEILKDFEDTDYFVKTKFIDINGIELFKKIKENDIEGIVAKLKTSKYVINTRTKNWIKIKNFKIETFYIGGYFYNENTFVFSVLLGEKKQNKLYFVGKMFISKKNKLFSLLENEKGIKSMFCNFNEKNIKFIDIKYTCKVKYIERTKSNHLRQPVFIEEYYE